MQDNSQNEQIYTVSLLNQEVKFLLEDTFSAVWVEGEISNFAAPGSGHWYFSLKDANAQVRCALFKGNQRGIHFKPRDGLHVLIKARVSLYPNRGDYQLIAEHMEERGEGKLRRAFELLKEKLEKAGLFDIAHKKSLPPFPETIGVITSPTGAAIQDILHVLKRRYPCTTVIIYPCQVQGIAAAPTIADAISVANQRQECDVLIVARGGGSLEDLWPFNDETVARTIFASQIPIISGVGHEVDFTIADFVADVRAPTPSAAAEIATPDRQELRQTLGRQEQLVGRQMKSKLRQLNQQIDWILTHLKLQHPKRRLLEKMQQLDMSELTLLQLQRDFLNKRQQALLQLSNRLDNVNPVATIQKQVTFLGFVIQRLQQTMQSRLNQKQSLLMNAACTLDALSPLNTLKRGYAIAETQQRQIIKDANAVKIGDEIRLQLLQGSLHCRVEDINKGSD
jgi:exodeoxyribonuclease VII large subunit